MKKQLTIGQQLTTGFALILTALAIISIWSVLGITHLTEDAGQVVLGNQLKANMKQSELDHLKWADQLGTLIYDNSIHELHLETNPHQCAFGKWYYSKERTELEQRIPSTRNLLSSIESWHNQLHESAVKIEQVYRPADTQLSAVLCECKSAHLNWADKVKSGLIDNSVQHIDAQTDSVQCAFGKWLTAPKTVALRTANPEADRILTRITPSHNQLHQGLSELNKLLKTGQRAEAIQYFIEQEEPQLQKVVGGIDELIQWSNLNVEGISKAADIYFKTSKPALNNIREHLSQIVDEISKNVQTDEQMLDNASHTKIGIIIVGSVSILAGIGIALCISAVIRKKLMHISEELSEASTQVAAASTQVNSASHSLAEGASEQAAGLEETSASLEEMTSMTKQSASHAQQANMLANDAKSAADGGVRAMQEMSMAINDIRSSSDETAKIIKVIDEIAFQTNLLALNAAVEAARAGEAGKGFAVVAEEVRNLAKRSADAAKSTAELIEDSVKRALNGVDISEKVEAALNEITNNVSKTTELISEIATASGEQSQGISQINSAITQMDQVTQANAANAEESASASQELNSQADHMTHIVNELIMLVNGAKSAPRIDPPDSRMYSPPKFQPPRPAPRSIKNTPPLSFTPTPEQAIPFDEDMDAFNAPGPVSHSKPSTSKPSTSKTASSNKQDLIKWTDALCIGISQIDQQHKKLVDIINQLDRAMRDRKGKDVLQEIIQNLTSYTHYHFSAEEELFELSDYEHIEEHKATHAKFIAKIDDFAENFSKGGLGLSIDIMTFLSDWLIHHIQGTDKNYVPYLKANGIK